jgi:hypothetical protein
VKRNGPSLSYDKRMNKKSDDKEGKSIEKGAEQRNRNQYQG